MIVSRSVSGRFSRHQKTSFARLSYSIPSMVTRNQSLGSFSKVSADGLCVKWTSSLDHETISAHPSPVSTCCSFNALDHADDVVKVLQLLCVDLEDDVAVDVQTIALG